MGGEASPDEVRAVFGARLRWVREQRKISQPELSEMADVMQPKLSKWERGEGRSPEPDQLFRLGQALGVPLEYLCDPDAVGDFRLYRTGSSAAAAIDPRIVDILRSTRMDPDVAVARLTQLPPDQMSPIAGKLVQARRVPKRKPKGKAADGGKSLPLLDRKPPSRTNGDGMPGKRK